MHYHIFVGLNGLYMPNHSETHETLGSARESLRWWRDQGDERPYYSNIRDGIVRFTENESATIERCYESDCMVEVEE